MKAFLSHSSLDKGIVREVADALGSARMVYDERTFSIAESIDDLIKENIENSNIFVLFLSRNSIESNFVREESKLAADIQKIHKERRLLVFCLDGFDPNNGFKFLKNINFERNVKSAAQISRRIIATATEIEIREKASKHVFIGRSKEISDIQNALMDPRSNNYSSIFITGLEGIGRTSLAEEVFRRLYKHISVPFPSIRISQSDSNSEIYRKLFAINTPIANRGSIETEFKNFDQLDEATQNKKILGILNDVIDQKESLLVYDDGGLLTDSGKIIKTFSYASEYLKSTHHPGLVFISNRAPTSPNTPGTLVRRLKEMTEADIRLLYGTLLRQPPQTTYDEDDLKELVRLSDGHPGNIYFCVEHIRRYGLDAFIQDPSEFVFMKQNRGREFLNQFEFDETDKDIVCCVSELPYTDSKSLYDNICGSAEDISTSIRSLIDRGVMNLDDGHYVISKPLRPAIEKSPEFQSRECLPGFMKSIAAELKVIDKDRDIDVAMIEPSILALLETEGAQSPFAGTFVLPSHRAWYARKLYSKKRYRDALKVAEEALQDDSRLSRVTAFECYSIAIRAASRLQENTPAERLLGRMRQAANSVREVGNYHFLQGFYDRKSRRYQSAEDNLRSCIEKNMNHASALRELAHLLYTFGRNGEALPFAESAHKRIPNNTYILDTYVGILLALYKENLNSNYKTTIDEYITLLHRISNDRENFAHLRQAEYDLIMNDKDRAHRSAISAVNNNPTNASSLILLAKTSMAVKSVVDMRRAISLMDEVQSNPDSGLGDGETRAFLELKARCLYMEGDATNARNLISKSGFHLDYEKNAIILEMV